MAFLKAVFLFLRGLLTSRATLLAENLALRQQLLILQRSVRQPRLRNYNRIFWAGLSRLWSNWPSALLVVKPETVLRWHRQGFRLFWHWKSKNRTGRPKSKAEVRDLIRRLSVENPTWGAPRIRSALRLLGYALSAQTKDQSDLVAETPHSPRRPRMEFSGRTAVRKGRRGSFTAARQDPSPRGVRTCSPGRGGQELAIPG